MKRIYLDNNATTQVDVKVVEIMNDVLQKVYGNPSSSHWFGREAFKIVSQAREDIAKTLNVNYQEIFFTSSGTESNNIALMGCVRENKKHIITSAIEHPSVLKCVEFLQKNGCEVSILPVDSTGLVNPDDVRKAIRSDTALISIMLANNEIGTIEPIKEISAIAKENNVIMHTDGVQALGKIPFSIKDLGVDMISFSAHKFHGPKGVGILFVKKGIKLNPVIFGGGQERGLRPGTECIHGIVGTAFALKKAVEEVDFCVEKIQNLRNIFLNQLEKYGVEFKINGDLNIILPNTLNICFKNVNIDKLLVVLDMEGVAISSGSACHSGASEPSHVLKMLGLPEEDLLCSVRISFSKYNTEEEVKVAGEIISKVVKRLRKSTG